MTNASRRNTMVARLFTGAVALAAGAVVIGLGGCDPGPKLSSQRGYRGTAMEDIWGRAELAHRVDSIAARIPTPLPPAPPPTAGPSPWRNVQVLNDISPAEFTRTMLAFSTWVAGTGNCAYCHNVAAPWDDTTSDGKPLYTKIVARRMIQMTRNINGNYSAHVKNTGVTCYTCHLGKPLPNGLWFYGEPNQYQRYFLDREGVRVQSHAVEASNANRSSVKQTEWTYALMINMSSALGVSCNHCHNSRAFWSWEQAPPQRVVAYVGAQMVRDLNQHYLSPLQTVFPASRRGPMGDAPKLQCVTCHNGAYKPLYAYQMAKLYPAVWGRPDWNGVPFPSIPSGAGDSTTSAAADSLLAAMGVANPGRAAAPAPGAAPSPAAAPNTQRGPQNTTGAMGGVGPSGQDTTKPKRRQ